MSKVHGKRYAYKFDFQGLIQQSTHHYTAPTVSGAPNFPFGLGLTDKSSGGNKSYGKFNSFVGSPGATSSSTTMLLPTNSSVHYNNAHPATTPGFQSTHSPAAAPPTYCWPAAAVYINVNNSRY